MSSDPSEPKPIPLGLDSTGSQLSTSTSIESPVSNSSIGSQLSDADGSLSSPLTRSLESQPAEHKKADKNFLIAAVKKGNLGVVRFLLEQKAEVNEKDAEGSTALHHAICISYKKKGTQEEIVKCLLDIKADPNLKGKEPDDRRAEKVDVSPLVMCACAGDCGAILGYKSVINLLLHAKADISEPHKDLSFVRKKFGKRNPLTEAAFNGDTAKIQRLHEAKADVNQYDGRGYSALHWAVRKGEDKLAAIACLLDLKANPNLPSIDGRLPLTIAVEKNAPETLGLLLTAKADAELCKENLLYYAVKEGSAKVLDPLVNIAGISIESRINIDENKKSYTPLHAAVSHSWIMGGFWKDPDVEQAKNNTVIDELLRLNANPEARSADGSTALMVAIERGHSLAQPYTLIEANVDLEAKRGTDTALSLAFARDHWPTFHGGDVTVGHLLKAKATLTKEMLAEQLDAVRTRPDYLDAYQSLVSVITDNIEGGYETLHSLLPERFPRPIVATEAPSAQPVPLPQPDAAPKNSQSYSAFSKLGFGFFTAASWYVGIESILDATGKDDLFKALHLQGQIVMACVGLLLPIVVACMIKKYYPNTQQATAAAQNTPDPS